MKFLMFILLTSTCVGGTLDNIVKIQKRFEHVHDVALQNRQRAIELFRMAEYNLAEDEIDQVCSFMNEYGVQPILNRLNRQEISVVRFRYMMGESADRNLIDIAIEAQKTGESDLDRFLGLLILEKYGILK